MPLYKKQVATGGTNIIEKSYNTKYLSIVKGTNINITAPFDIQAVLITPITGQNETVNLLSLCWIVGGGLISAIANTGNCNENIAVTKHDNFNINIETDYPYINGEYIITILDDAGEIH